jgi:hypothetical protein
MLKHIIVLRPIGPMFQELQNIAFIYTFKPHSEFDEGKATAPIIYFGLHEI